MMRKVLIAIWIVFSLGWSGMFIFIYFLGAGSHAGNYTRKWGQIPFLTRSRVKVG